VQAFSPRRRKRDVIVPHGGDSCRGSDGNLSNSNILVTGLFHRLPCPFDICLHSVPAMKMI